MERSDGSFWDVEATFKLKRKEAMRGRGITTVEEHQSARAATAHPIP